MDTCLCFGFCSSVQPHSNFLYTLFNKVNIIGYKACHEERRCVISHTPRRAHLEKYLQSQITDIVWHVTLHLRYLLHGGWRRRCDRSYVVINTSKKKLSSGYAIDARKQPPVLPLHGSNQLDRRNRLQKRGRGGVTGDTLPILSIILWEPLTDWRREGGHEQELPKMHCEETSIFSGGGRMMGEV